MTNEQIEIAAKLYLQLAKDQVKPSDPNYDNVLRLEARYLADKMFMQIFNESDMQKFNFKDAIQSWYLIKQAINTISIF
jgi:hypothetical protein